MLKFEDLTPGQILAISVSLDVPNDRSLSEFLEENATDLSFKPIEGDIVEVRSDDQGGTMTGQLVWTGSGAENLDLWVMTWDGWSF